LLANVEIALVLGDAAVGCPEEVLPVCVVTLLDSNWEWDFSLLAAIHAPALAHKMLTVP